MFRRRQYPVTSLVPALRDAGLFVLAVQFTISLLFAGFPPASPSDFAAAYHSHFASYAASAPVTVAGIEDATDESHNACHLCRPDNAILPSPPSTFELVAFVAEAVVYPEVAERPALAIAPGPLWPRAPPRVL